MKQFFFIITFLLLCGKAFCQSLTVDEISAMVTGSDNKSFLVSKGFALCNDCLGEGSLYGYQKNRGTPDEETVVFYAKSFDYMSHSLKFINTLMDQAKDKYKLVKTAQQDDSADDSKSLKSYWFANGSVMMSFIIFKSFGLISIGPK